MATQLRPGATALNPRKIASRAVLALSMVLALLFTASCTDTEENWQQAEVKVRAFLDQLRKGEYENAHANLKSGAGAASMSSQEFAKYMARYEDTGLFDFTYQVKRHKADNRAKLYNFYVERTYRSEPDLSAAPVDPNDPRIAELGGLSNLTEFIVGHFPGEGWKITSITIAREYDVGMGTIDPKRDDADKQE